MQPNLVTCLFAGVGVWRLALGGVALVHTRAAGPAKGPAGGGRAQGPPPTAAATAASGALVLAMCVAVFLRLRSYAASDQSDSWYLHRYGTALLDSVSPHGALVTTNDHHWTTARYLTACEGYRYGAHSHTHTHTLPCTSLVL